MRNAPPQQRQERALIEGAIISVDLGDPANNPLATARQWSPAALLQYYFFDSSFALRPYLGLGFTYTWFTDVELNAAFDDTLNSSFGRTLALARHWQVLRRGTAYRPTSVGDRD